MTHTRRHTLARARRGIGSTYPVGYCLRFVRECFGIGARYPDAATAWAAAKDKHTDRHPPAGVPVWWTGGRAGHGHVAISDGYGYVIGTDAPTTGRVGKVPLWWIERHWGLTYRGWTTELNGVPVPPDPIAISANLLVGRHLKAVRAGVADHLDQGADAVAFQEGSGYRAIIRKEARAHGYRKPIVAHRRAGRGMDSTSLLVRDGVPLIASGVAKARGPWIGPRIRINWPGRAIAWAVVDLDGTLTVIEAVHGPTGRNGINRYAYRRYLRRIRRVTRKKMRRHKATAFLIVGDWNCPDGATDKRSVRRRVAAKLDAQLVRTGTHLDYAVTRGLGRLDGNTGPRHGSDHPSIRITHKETK